MIVGYPEIMQLLDSVNARLGEQSDSTPEKDAEAVEAELRRYGIDPDALSEAILEGAMDCVSRGPVDKATACRDISSLCLVYFFLGAEVVTRAKAKT